MRRPFCLCGNKNYSKLPVRVITAESKMCIRDRLWTEGRPARPATPAWILPKEYAGFSPAGKLERLRGKLKELGCLSLIHI